MTREQYRDRLASLRSRVHAMGHLAVDRFESGVEALASGDRELAREVVEGDHELNELYLELEGECVDLLALQQPVAGDLRLVAASFKVLTDAERIGDLAANLAEYGLDAPEAGSDLVDVEPLGERAATMARDAFDAYADDDVAACREVADRDDELDAACREASAAVVRDLVDADAASLNDAAVEDRLADVSTALLAIRDVERVGDHAVNVAARTLYQVENDDELLY